MQPKKEPKKIILSPKTIWILSGAIALLVIAVLLSVLLTPKFSPASTGYHIIKNSLPAEYDYYPYLKDGNIYLFDGNQSVLVGEKVYSEKTPSTIDAVDYVWNMEKKQIIFLSDPQGEKNLMLYKDGAAAIIAKNVDAWRTISSFDRVAVITGADSTTGAGNLMQYYNGSLTSIDTNIQTNSIRYSPDGNYLFAVKGTSSSNNKAILLSYDMQGNRTILQENISSLSWVSEKGDTYIVFPNNPTLTNEYDYRIVHAGKSVNLNNVYLSSTASDSSVIYMIADYNTETKTGTLIAMDTATLKQKTLANNVSYMNPDAVTDLSKGIVYSCPTATADRYNIYYTPLQGATQQLIKNAYESSLFSICLNTQTNTGYILVHGISVDQNALHYITWNDKKQTTTKLDSGSIYEIVYYEACDSVLYIKNGSENFAELYLAKGTAEPDRLLLKAGAIYDEDNSAYYSCSMISNDGKKLIYFTNLITMENNTEDPYYTHPLAKTRGTLMMLNLQTSEITKIAENVRADSYNVIQADADMSHVYYSVLTDLRFNLYLYKNGASTLIAEESAGPLNYFVQ